MKDSSRMSKRRKKWLKRANKKSSNKHKQSNKNRPNKRKENSNKVSKNNYKKRRRLKGYLNNIVNEGRKLNKKN
jgi:hypothetical protein